MDNQVYSKGLIKKVLLVIFIIIVTFIAFIAFTFNYRRDIELIAPGVITPVSDTISIEGYPNIATSNFHTTAVYVLERPTLAQSFFFKLFNNNVQQRKMSNSYEHLSLDELAKGSRLSYISSKYIATITAYEAANIEIFYEVDGLYVTYYANYDHFKNKISVGDLITEVNDVKIDSIDRFRELVNADDSCGSTVKLSLQKENEDIYDLNVPLTKDTNANTCKVGLGLYEKVEILDETTPYPAINIPDNVGGSSGGLMSALQVYSILSERDLMKGYKIAGTGTINLDGTVGSIGAADLKVVTAEKNDVDIFFVPTDKDDYQQNYSDAIRGSEMIDTDIKIYGVNTLEEAIAILESLEQKN